ncbi:SDR family NAD(P)-dependent oxidoreductase [Noviherbaspirillum cavernae]|uniref:SDR family NAD(P)-dependent oxidoreductase n=1 Tax=Noviherbaspirillum cavernae TaxID=2320862 RepID=A0A418WUV0_9BURK|nr:SDR family NAD(P)-dependent oxidoreductase [Noviherbaspirillum cavernae]RJF96472.1 SDR family NAD(P)-dependent oxidoreductase [Noviherbaspirillum cavernae]
MSNNSRIIVITGAAGGLGRVVADAFLSADAHLVLVDVPSAPLPPSGDRRTSVAVDLVNADATEKALSEVLQKLGPAHVLCNIAGGFTMGTDVHATPDQTWRHMMDLNVATLINASRAVVPGMIAAGRGKLINVAAASANSGKANMGAYVMAKSGVARLTESMALELREHGINVNAVAPSIIDTEANRRDMPNADFERWVTPAQLGNVMRFLASEDASAVHGAVIPVTGLS